MFCSKCSTTIEKTSKFCYKCNSSYPPPTLLDDSNDDDVQYIKSSTKLSILGSLSQIPSSSTHGSLVSIDVRAVKAKATFQDRATSKDVQPTSKFGVDPQGKTVECQIADLQLIQQGEPPTRYLGAYLQLKLYPFQDVSNWLDWVREQVKGFQIWEDRPRPHEYIDNTKR